MNILNIILFFNLIVYPVFSQNYGNCDKPLPTEKIFLHTDRDRYITGEKIWFKAYCLENDSLLSKFSKILYIELFDANKNVYLQKKHKLSKGTAFGSLLIPENINSGNYFLRAYTLYQRNFPVENLYTQVVSIINPENKSQEIENIQQPDKTKFEKVNNTKSYKFLPIKTSKSKYHQREKIKLKIDNFDEIADMSISVRIKGSGYDNEIIKLYYAQNNWLQYFFENSKIYSSSYNFNKKNILKNVNDLKWIPEIRYLTLSGIVRKKETEEPVPNLTCISSVISKKPQIHMTNTGKDGRFVFSFNNLRGEHKLFVGIKDNSDDETEILVNNNFSSDFPEIQNIPLIYDDSLNKIFETIFLNYQISKKFKPINNKNAFPFYNHSFSGFNLGNPDIIIDLKTYIELPSLDYIIRELIPGVNVYGPRGERGISIFSKREKRTYKDPLILLDNIPIFNIEKLLQIEPSLIKTIEVYNSKYILGNHYLNGIFSIKTKTNNFASYKWDDNSVFVSVKTLDKPQIFTYPDYSESISSPIPDFRTTLYWNPIINSENINDIQFFSSDICNTYEVIIKGFSKTGKSFFGKTEFEVVR